jgi:hypothetical protein
MLGPLDGPLALLEGCVELDDDEDPVEVVTVTFSPPRALSVRPKTCKSMPLKLLTTW